jgi:hypothetical protein
MAFYVGHSQHRALQHPMLSLLLCGRILLQAADAQQQLAESRAEWEVALQVLRQEKAAAAAQLRKAMVRCYCMLRYTCVGHGVLT